MPLSALFIHVFFINYVTFVQPMYVKVKQVCHAAVCCFIQTRAMIVMLIIPKRTGRRTEEGR